jgi:hypothetical protein
MQSLSTQHKNRHLVSVRRTGVDPNSIQGFVVGLSEHLVALEYVHDFQIDGLLVLRRSDITDVRRKKTDEFQQALLKQEGITVGAQTPKQPLQLQSWQTVITQLSTLFPIMILERELRPEPTFSIGRVLKATAVQLEFRSFSGTARWYTKVERLKYAHLTALRVNARYANFYQRHFERHAA